MISLVAVSVITALVSRLYISSSSEDSNGFPCSWNTALSLTAFCVTRVSFPPVSSWCCVRFSLLPVQYCLSNSCCIFESSGAMRKYLSSDFSFCVIPTMPPITLSSRFSCSIPWSGPIDVNPATPLVTQKLPFMNSAQISGCCCSVCCIVEMYSGRRRA